MFRGWESYYFMIGSAGAGLIGLLFVVVTLTQGIERSRALRGTSLYMTPSVVHFGAVLAMSAIAMAPGLSIEATAALFGLVALVGLGNSISASVGIRFNPPGVEAAHWSDLWLYGIVPALVYVGLVATAVALWERAYWAPYANAALLMALLFIGIRNAWDLITWMAPMRAALAGSADGLGAVAGDQAGADGVAVDAREEHAGERKQD
jgi:hypothetical protein